uniref:Uncharacterized protein n=1 Tax=Arundo donax TaxID=35708 RepID=A0A0A9ACQ6_ARUDO
MTCSTLHRAVHTSMLLRLNATSRGPPTMAQVPCSLIPRTSSPTPHAVPSSYAVVTWLVRAMAIRTLPLSRGCFARTSSLIWLCARTKIQSSGMETSEYETFELQSKAFKCQLSVPKLKPVKISRCHKVFRLSSNREPGCKRGQACSLHTEEASGNLVFQLPFLICK